MANPMFTNLTPPAPTDAQLIKPPPEGEFRGPSPQAGQESWDNHMKQIVPQAGLL
jgi:hypothetical protein